MDDLLPNDGQSFNPMAFPEDREIENKEELAKAAQAYPILDELIAGFEQRIKNADSMSARGITPATPAIQVQILMEGSRNNVSMLEADIQWLKGLKDLYESR